MRAWLDQLDHDLFSDRLNRSDFWSKCRYQTKLCPFFPVEGVKTRSIGSLSSSPSQSGALRGSTSASAAAAFAAPLELPWRLRWIHSQENQLRKDQLAGLSWPTVASILPKRSLPSTPWASTAKLPS